ncbi:MAG TPA: class I SAM-dependent methyltransferase [Polyangiaceae bacterium]|jgi:SAM-dependent methyltransferase|nr:class I SAM-dependent methyltransferase [Polyangiaceae bacterium]
MLDDVDLFLELNQEYAAKPLIPRPPRYDPATLLQRGRARAQDLENRHHIRGKRVLEFGCGPGETARALAAELDCKVVAVDIERSCVEQWAQHDSAGVDFRLFDLSREDPCALGEFDFIYSNGTLEHVVHPFALLTTLMKLLPAGGRMHFNMGLHRGTMGSHLYRDVLFPWPHLVFTEPTFERFYERMGKPPRRPVWINHITAAQWLEMFDVLGLHVEAAWYSIRAIDRSFYDRFEDILSRYPIYDLERDLMYVDLVKPDSQRLLELSDPAHPSGATLKRRRFEAFRSEVVRVERIAENRLARLREPRGESDEPRIEIDPLLHIAAELQQKVTRLQVIEERLNQDLNTVRKLGRAMNWTGSLLGRAREAIHSRRHSG